MSTIVVLATEWLPSKGGLSAFNMELCLALARVGHEVHCVVPRCSEEDRSHALDVGVTLHSGADQGVLDGAPFELGVKPDIVVGHDRPTGPSAARWRERHVGARFALILHVHPGQIDGLKSDASIAARSGRVRDTKRLIEHADAAFAVGSQLTDWWNAQAPDLAVRPFVPGLPTTLPDDGASPVEHPRVMLLGRAEDAELKGVGVAARAMRIVTESGFPNAELMVRGVAAGTENAFEREVRASYPKPKRFYPQPFDPSRKTIAHDLRSAALVLQPSLEDGFGLVTLEAISVGTPVLVSERAGVARLLKRVDPKAAESVVVEAGNPDAWAQAIAGVLGEPVAARAVVGALKEAIEDKHSWDSAATDLVNRTSAAPRIPGAPRETLLETCWRVSTAVREYPRKTDGHWILREREQSAIASWLETDLPQHENGALLVVGAPGTGKSALLGWLVHEAREGYAPVLAVKADQLPPRVDTPEQLRAHLGLLAPVESSLQELVALYGTAVLVVDQLDALCEVVDSHTGRLNALLAVIRRAIELDGVRVVASVRPFELLHEARLRRVADGARKVHLGGLSPKHLSSLLAPCVVPTPADPHLSTPHALDLMVQLRLKDGARFGFPDSVGQLRERFWRRAIADDPLREEAALTIAGAMDASGMLWVQPPQNLTAAVAALLEAGLLLADHATGRVGFRHQSLSDFARVRALIRDDELEEHIRKHQSKLEIRPLVRSALVYLRETERRQYHALAGGLLKTAALHVKLLVVDTLLEAASPSPVEQALFREAVRDPATRRRALGGIRHRGWLTALETSLTGWMVDHPDEAEPMAARYLRLAPLSAVRALELSWGGDPNGRSRITRILSRAERLGPEADSLVGRITPHLVRESRFEFGPIAAAIATDSPMRAAKFLASCLAEVYGAGCNGEEVSGDARVFDELELLEVEPEPLLDLFEPIADAWDIESFRPPLYSWSFDLDEALDRLLATLLTKSPALFFARASRTEERAGLRRYAKVMGRSHGSTRAKVLWLLGGQERLGLDPESSDVVASLRDLDTEAVGKLDEAIGEVALYTRFGEDESAADRRRRLRANRKYRLHLRSLLPQQFRAAPRRRFDEDEEAQLPGPPFEPHRGGRGGFVVSPMTKEQLVAARDADVLEALKRDRRPFEFDDSDRPIGGPREIVSELRELAEDEPERVLRLVEKMRDEGQARGLLLALAKHHPNPAAIERLAVSLFDVSDSPLHVDDECAWALSELTKRIELRPATIEALTARLDSAGPAEAERADTDDDVQHLLLFPGQTLGGVIPPGAYPWLMALARYLLREGGIAPETWARAFRAVLRTGSPPRAIPMLLNQVAHCWPLLGGDHWFPLVEEATRGPLSPEMAQAATHLLALHRGKLTAGQMELWLMRLVQSGYETGAAELAVLLSTERGAHSSVASKLLSSWIQTDGCEGYARGVMGAIDGLLGTNDRRTEVALLGEQWISLAAPEDLDIVLSAVSDESVWRPDNTCVRLISQLQRRISEMSDDGLYRLGTLLERFLRDHPLLVLSLADEILSAVLSREPGIHTAPVIGDCLAASISLRLALPDENARTHSLFERALAAGAPAAFEALDRLDGRDQPRVVPRRRAPRRVRSRRRRRRR